MTTIDFDRQEANDELADAQRVAMADYRHEIDTLSRNLAVARGDLASALHDRDTLGVRLYEVEQMNAELSKRADQLNDDAYRYLAEAIDLCNVLNDTLVSGAGLTAALAYFAAILRYYREKFHAPDYGSDIPF